MALNRIHSLGKGAGSVTGLIAFAVLMLACNCAWSEGLFDESVRAQMLKHGDGRVAHVETEYNDLYINKRGRLLALATRFKNESYFDSIVDLKDPDVMPVPYARIMPAALLYPETTKRVLMIGLGAGSISTYLGRAMPDIQIDVVELDPGVIAAGKRYFGLHETEKVRFIESDGRVYLTRHKDLYDLILLDAYRELGVPFHLLTREFYTLVKERLASGGAAAFRAFSGKVDTGFPQKMRPLKESRALFRFNLIGTRSNIYAGTKLYLSTLVTLRAAFQTVDIYPDWSAPDEAQAIAVAVAATRPGAYTLMQRAVALQDQRHFRYPLPALVGRRDADQNSEGGDLLTDDFAPVNLYETMPIRRQKR
jgi:spermidine synthase